MTLRTVTALALLAAAPLFFALPSAAGAAIQQTGALPRGGSYVIDSDPTIGAAAIALWFRAPGAGYDNAAPGISRLAATAAAASPLSGGKSLYELVHSLGGDLSINVYPDIVGIDATIPASAARQVVAAMTQAYFSPAIDDDAVKTAQKDGAVLAVQARYSFDLTLHDLLFEQIFAGGPAHYPPLPYSIAELTRIQPDAVSAFAKRAFRSANAVLTLSGNVDASTIDAVTGAGGKGSMDSPYDSTLAQDPASTTASGLIGGIGLAWVGPPIADQKAATALDFVADYLFREDTGVVAKAIGNQNSDALFVGQFITLHDPGVMLVAIGSDDPKTKNAAKQQVLDALAKLQQPMDAQTFDGAREAFLYHVASDTETPQEQADNLGWYAVEGSSGYAPGSSTGTYDRDARALDPQYVAGIVRRYLSNPVIVNLVTAPPGKETSS